MLDDMSGCARGGNTITSPALTSLLTYWCLTACALEIFLFCVMEISIYVVLLLTIKMTIRSHVIATQLNVNSYNSS